MHYKLFTKELSPYYKAYSEMSVRAMLVCGCPASKGGILRAISPAGRRFRASALVYGRRSHDVYTFVCIHVHLFFVFAFRDARFHDVRRAW